MESANVKQNISTLENSISEVQKILRDSKNLAENTRSEIVGMESTVSLLTDDTPKAFFPQISEMFKDFQQEVKNQGDANEYFQKQLTDLKKESSIIHQKIIASNTKSKILEDAVGFN
jgi:septal ring factor EnvC (AmiA/AmiB activator)